ncbi:MAG: hypothetical protein RLZZ457_272 [Pseudomonadota bacterium]|jgi:hypothetical protein
MTHHTQRLLSAITCLAFCGCSALLPKARTESPTFQSFDEAKQAIESIVPMQSHRALLSEMKIDPPNQPNAVILSYADILKRVVNGSVLSKTDLGPGLALCINAHEACRGWELNIAQIHKQRLGGFWSDFFNFRRHSVTTGWRFNALILLVDDVVVYRSWGGQPEIHEVDIQQNPLGPLQEIGPAVVGHR